MNCSTNSFFLGPRLWLSLLELKAGETHFCKGKLSYWAIFSQFWKIEYHCMMCCQNGLNIGYFQNQWKLSKIAYLRIDFSLISSKGTLQYVCRIIKPLKRAFQNWSYMPKTSISKEITPILSKAYKITKIMLFSLRFFYLTSWGWAKPGSVSSLVRERLRFSASSKIDFNFPNGPQKIEILKRLDPSFHVKSH